jgi:hypothetical protein
MTHLLSRKPSAYDVSQTIVGRESGEERLEQFVSDVGRNAGAIVLHTDFHRITDVTGADLQRRHQLRIAAVTCPPRCRVEAIGEEVEKHPRDVLRVDIDRGDAFAPATRDARAPH